MGPWYLVCLHRVLGLRGWELRVKGLGFRGWDSGPDHNDAQLKLTGRLRCCPSGGKS